MVPSPSRLDAGLPRLYAILDIDLAKAKGISPAEILEIWLDAGVRLVQIRAKSLSSGPLCAVVTDLARLCAGSDVRLIVNDRADVARLTRVAGVHLGQEDLAVADARALLLPEQLIGVSAHTAAQVQSAVGESADYVAIGPVFATSTKLHPDPVVGLAGVTEAATLARRAIRPLVAIGGITLGSARSIIEAGADAVAVISDLFAGDWRRRASDFQRALQ